LTVAASVMKQDLRETTTTATFVAVVDPGTCISFQFARCRFSVFCYLLFNLDL